MNKFFPYYEGTLLPDRDYLFAVASSTMGDWFLTQIEAAQRQRREVVDEQTCSKQVEMSSRILDEL